jgi:hypothetical protein
MEQDYNKEIEKIVGCFECPKDFQCYKSGLEVLCEAHDIGLDTYLKCLEKDPRSCQFSVPFGDGYFCECPLRVYICKKLGK